MPEFRTGRALVGGLPSGKTEVRQSQCVVMKSTDVRDRELVHGQTLDFLTTDADVEGRGDHVRTWEARRNAQGTRREGPLLNLL